MENRGESHVRLGPRIPRDHIGVMDSVAEIATPNRVVEPRADSTSSSSSSTTTSCGENACQTGVTSSSYTLPVILGTVIPVVGAIILFVILHRRHVRKQREEDANDRHASLDFGLGDVPQPGRARKPPGEQGMSEKSRRQVSMDISVNSPYMLPPELQNSRESLHSLTRTVHQKEDPYRTVSTYYQGDARSIHSNSKNGSSIYTGSSAAPSRMQEVATADLLGNAASMPKSMPPQGGELFVPPPRQNSLPQYNAPSPSASIPEVPKTPTPPPQARLQQPGSPESIKRKGLPTNPRPGQALTPTQGLTPMPSSAVIEDARDSYASNPHASLRQSNNYLGSLIDSAPGPTQVALARPQIPNALPASPRPPPRTDSRPTPPSNDEYGDGFMVTPPSPGRENKNEAIRGQRYSMDVPPEEFAQAGLGAPGFDPKRLSMGFRPLPPNAATESDDPEIRANRIRSFYKEYFDDSKPEPQGQYIEDYDENYMGDAAYYDPDSNAFVMPYAEPVTRRAMTPPPGGRPKFMGQGPPRPRNGSMGGMSAGGRPGGPQFRGPPGPRAQSSASGRMGPPGQQQKPRKPIAPPQALNTLPTPSKLRDDSFALMQSMEFAPPTSIRERQAGRSQSPFGERRPYSPTVPAFTPTVSAFEELAPMPSPHLLRRSGTFTGLDFAPPKRIRDPDTMSDAGSIRSNKSGVSQVQLSAIRNGAYRASRIPKEAVFTKDDMASQLKPQWGMRADK